MADENYRGKDQPKLKVVDEDQPVHRLGSQSPKKTPSKKKALLNRTNENEAIFHDVVGDEPDPHSPPKPTPTPEEEANASTSPATPLRIPPAFIALVAFAFLGLFAIGIFLALGGRNRDRRNSMQDRSRLNLEAARQEKEEAREIVEALTTALENYTAASTIEEKLAYARQPKRVEPLMRDYYEKHPLVPLEGAELVSQYALPIESRSFVILTASFPDSPNKIYLAEADTDLNIRIDWESDACYQPVEISEYIAEKSTEPVNLRVFAQPDNFYVYEFSDSSKYQCLKLTFRDNDEFLFGYVERATPTSVSLANHFQLARRTGNTNAEPLFLKVRFPENAKGERGVIIEEFIASRWANIEESEINE